MLRFFRINSSASAKPVKNINFVNESKPDKLSIQGQYKNNLKQFSHKEIDKNPTPVEKTTSENIENNFDPFDFPDPPMPF